MHEALKICCSNWHIKRSNDRLQLRAINERETPSKGQYYEFLASFSLTLQKLFIILTFTLNFSVLLNFSIPTN